MSYISRLLNLCLRYRRMLVVFSHLALIFLSYLTAFFLRFDLSLPVAYQPVFAKTLPLLLLVKFSVFYYFGIFRGLWRYVSTGDLWQIIKANVVASSIFIASEVFIFGVIGFPRSVFLSDFIICTTFVSGIRFFVRLIRESFRIGRPEKRKRVLVVGAGKAGVLILREYRNNPSLGEVVGFIDDDPLKANASIQNIRILGTSENIPEIVPEYAIEEIVIALPSAKGEEVRRVISFCQLPDVKLKIVPALKRILNGEIEVKARDVKPEDLLGREVNKVNEEDIVSYIEGKTVLVTGAGGSIGSALCRQLVRYSPKLLVLLDHNENGIYFLQVEFKTKEPNVPVELVVGDIKDVSLLKNVFARLKPEVVFHAAAHKHVPLMEENPVAAVKNNVIGTRNLIYAAHHYGCERFVLISTDKAVNPTSIMGASKRIAEIVLQAKAKASRTKFMAVRFGNVIGSDGSVIPLFKKQIEEGGPVTVTHPEVKRYFMSAQEAAELVLQAGALGSKGEIFVLDMGEQIKILDLAKNLIILSGLKPGKDIQIDFVGLRPGEKLYEEMFLDFEKGKTTRHKKIHIAPSRDFDSKVIRTFIKELERLADEMKGEKAASKMLEIIKLSRQQQADEERPDLRERLEQRGVVAGQNQYSPLGATGRAPYSPSGTTGQAGSKDSSIA